MVEITYQMVLSTLQTIALIVGIAYYLIIMRNSQRNQEISLKNQELTLQSQELTRKAQEHATETRQAQLFMQLNSRWREIDWQRITPTISTKVSGWEEVKERSENDPEFRYMISEIPSMYEYLGVIVKEGYLRIRLVALMWAGMTRTFWENIVEPILDEMREDTGYARGLSETEYVCRELLKYMDEHPELAT
jgi:hypothetical protein